MYDMNNVFERCNVAIHTVHCLHSNEDITMASHDSFVAIYQLFDDRHQGIGRVVGKGDLPAGSAETHTIVDAGVNEFVVNNDISRLRQTREKTNICIEARVAQ